MGTGGISSADSDLILLSSDSGLSGTSSGGGRGKDLRGACILLGRSGRSVVEVEPDRDRERDMERGGVPALLRLLILTGVIDRGEAPGVPRRPHGMGGVSSPGVGIEANDPFRLGFFKIDFGVRGGKSVSNSSASASASLIDTANDPKSCSGSECRV